MPLIVVDVEADGPIPGDYSMIALGACLVDGLFKTTFHANLQPISDRWVPEALAVSGLTREQTLAFGPAPDAMARFDHWLAQVSPGRGTFISDNPIFDGMFVFWYFHHFLHKNPFGFSGRRIGDLYSGMKMDMAVGSNWKKLRRTRHTHDPVDDAIGNAEALWAMKAQGLKLIL